MDDNRLVKRAAKVQWSMKERGNLFCDAPNLSFERLNAIAKDRIRWRGLVNKLQRNNEKLWKRRPDSTHSCKLRSDKPINTVLSAKSQAFNPTAPAVRLFPIFRPDATPPNAPKRNRKKTKPKQIQQPLTDKERAQAARDHYYLHHGHEAASNPFADRRVKQKFTFPTWAAAKAAVFDSSSSSDEEQVNNLTASAEGGILNADLNNNDNANTSSGTDSIIWASAAPRPDRKSDQWVAPAPRSNLSDD